MNFIFCISLKRLQKRTKLKKLVRITSVPVSLDKLLGKQLSYMNSYFDVCVVSSDNNALEKVAKKYGVRHHAVEMSRKISPLKDLKSIWNMYLFLKNEKPEMVHSHTPKAGLVGMTAAYFARVPIRMHTVAGLPLLEEQGVKRMILNLVEKFTYSLATKVYPNSFKLKNIILDAKFCSASKLKVIANGSSNGVDLEHFNGKHYSETQQEELRKSLDISDKDFIYIYVGRLVKDKGVNELVTAFKHVFQKYVNGQKNVNHKNLNFFVKMPKLLLVGNYESHLDPLNRATLEEINNNPNIVFIDYQEDVRPFYKISDCLVLPSYREGFPNVVLQALAMNLPAIVSDINGCNELISHAKNGLIVPAKNAKELEIKMLLLLGDAVICENFRENCRPIVMKYDQQFLWKELHQVYDTALMF